MDIFYLPKLTLSSSKVCIFDGFLVQKCITFNDMFLSALLVHISFVLSKAIL